MMTATQVRMEKMAVDGAYAMLCEHPELQAEAIAKHYLAHAELAKTILRLLQVRAGIETPINIDQVIEVAIRDIKDNHAHDLGIRLEWNQ